MKNIAILEGLRGWLASWVMVSHLMLYCAVSSEGHKSHFLKNIIETLTNGRSAVWIFMILSGFVNFYLLDVKREKPFVYIVRRFLRLYPLYITLFIASIFINQFHLYSLTHISWAGDAWVTGQYHVTQEAYRYFAPNLLVHAVMLHGLVPRVAWPGTSSAFLGVDWSISTEWQFYLLAPALFYLSRKNNALIWLGLLAILSLWSDSNHELRKLFENDNPSLLLFKGYLFYVGSVSYLFYKQTVSGERPVNWTPWHYFGLGLILVYMISLDPILLLWVALFGLVLLRHAFPDDRWLHRASLLFTNRWAQYLGLISYSIYLFHWVAIMIVLRLLLVVAPGISAASAAWIVFPAVIVLTFTASHFLYQYLEKPLINFGKRLFNEPLT
jgi:peptidoglycan/LPS O-acetylase OafA/YrhL